MKKFRFLMLSLIAVATLVGCGQDQGLYLPPNPKPQPTPGEGEYPLISTKPAFVTEDMTENVIVTLNTAGTSMAGFTGQLYAHTGVLTDQSATTGDWKYVKADWEENIPACCLENIDSDLWELVITGGPRAFYGVPEGETITHLAFVFRSADGKQELKDKGNDIFIELASEGMSVRIISPSHGDILKLNEECTVQVNQKDATNVKLYKNDEMVSESGSATLTYKFTPTEPEDITFKAVATNGSETLEDSVSVAVLGETVDEAMPGGVIDGVGYHHAVCGFALGDGYILFVGNGHLEQLVDLIGDLLCSLFVICECFLIGGFYGFDRFLYGSHRLCIRADHLTQRAGVDLVGKGREVCKEGGLLTEQRFAVDGQAVLIQEDAGKQIFSVYGYGRIGYDLAVFGIHVQGFGDLGDHAAGKQAVAFKCDGKRTALQCLFDHRFGFCVIAEELVAGVLQRLVQRCLRIRLKIFYLDFGGRAGGKEQATCDQSDNEQERQ